MLVNRLQERESIASGKLSRREIEVLRTLEAGGSDKQLARQLGLSEHGVRFHLKNIFKKMGVHDSASTVAATRKLDLDAATSPFRSVRPDYHTPYVGDAQGWETE